MKYSEPFKAALIRMKNNPTEAAPVSELSSGYWSMLLECIGSLVREKGDLGAFLQAESDFVNYGLCPELYPDTDDFKKSILDISTAKSRIQIINIAEWLEDLASKINQGDKKEQLERDIKLSQIQISKVNNELKQAQSDRKDHFKRFLTENNLLNANAQKHLDSLDSTDQLLQDSIKSKKSISRGVFFSVEQKREHAARENQLLKEMDKINSLTESVSDRELALEIKQESEKIKECLSKVVNLEDAVCRMTAEIEDIDKKQQEISPLEVESRIRKEIEYLRDLLKLSAKRLHMECCPIIHPGDKVFSMSVLMECLDRVLEFDPLLFKNDRVNLFGRPQILLAPGSGNSLYDWKNNRIVVPLVVPGGNFMASIAAGIIEYRLDVDEDKKLLTSYNQIPELKAIRSIVQLRTRLIKDYIVWMTSEYKGFRILPKNIKEWFEREVAPNKNEIFTPLEYQPYAIATADYKKMLAEVEEKIAKGADTCAIENLWCGSILYYQQGKFDRSLELLLALLKRDDSNLMAHYNVGQVGMKLMRRQEALKGFEIYCARNSQSWWARIARDHMRRLQA